MKPQSPSVKRPRFGPGFTAFAFATLAATAMAVAPGCDTGNEVGESDGGAGGAATTGTGATGGAQTSAAVGGMGGAGSTVAVSVGVSTGGGMSVEQFAELWYSVDDRLVRLPIDPTDGTAQPFQESVITNPPPLGQNLLTMMPDGSLIGGRLSTADDLTYFYYVADPPRDGSDVTVVDLGVMPESLMLEGLYTDCEGLLYGMDTGSHNTNSDGNRLLRFDGDFVNGDFSYVVVSDLSTADVADIDDMGPGIDANGDITDNPGFAIDSGMVHVFNYEVGSGTYAADGGTWGIHALGGSLFNDATSRLFLLNSTAELFEMDPGTYVVSPVLMTGPTNVNGNAGHSGLAGPLTNCTTGFTPPN